jgi:hypothetical protein
MCGQDVPVSFSYRNVREKNLHTGDIERSMKTLENTENFLNVHDESEKMDVVCAWCGKHLRKCKGPSRTTSHGICKQCFESLEM